MVWKSKSLVNMFGHCPNADHTCDAYMTISIPIIPESYSTLLQNILLGPTHPENNATDSSIFIYKESIWETQCYFKIRQRQGKVVIQKKGRMRLTLSRKCATALSILIPSIGLEHPVLWSRGALPVFRYEVVVSDRVSSMLLLVALCSKDFDTGQRLGQHPNFPFLQDQPRQHSAWGSLTEDHSGLWEVAHGPANGPTVGGRRSHKSLRTVALLKALPEGIRMELVATIAILSAIFHLLQPGGLVPLWWKMT